MDSFFTTIKVFFLVYIIAVAFMLYFHHKNKQAFIFYGDLYINKGGREVYIPFGSSFFLTLLLFLLGFIAKKILFG